MLRKLSRAIRITLLSLFALLLVLVAAGRAEGRRDTLES